MRRIIAQVGDEFRPLAAGHLNLGDSGNKTGDLVANEGGLSGELCHERLFQLRLKDWLKFQPEILQASILYKRDKM